MVGGGLLAAPPAHAQAPSAAPVQTITFPVQDLSFDVSSLDRTVSVNAKRVRLAADVLFGFNSAQLSRRAAPRLDQAVREIRRRKPAAVRVDGYTDAKGSTAFNRRLSAARARSVRRALARRLGASGPALTVRAFGERGPVAANTKEDGSDNPKGRALNRRVELSFR